MKRCLLILQILAFSVFVAAQGRNIDSLKHEAEITTNDTVRYVHLLLLSRYYLETKPDSGLYYSEKMSQLARKLKLKLDEANAISQVAYAKQNMGNYPASLKNYLSAMEIANDPESADRILPPKYLELMGLNPGLTGKMFQLVTLSSIHMLMAILYENANDYEKDLYHLRYARQYGEQIKDTFNLTFVYYVLGRVYLSVGKNDSAFIYLQKAYDYSLKTGSSPSGPLLTLGKYYFAIGNDQEAVNYLRNALSKCRDEKYYRGVVASNLLLSAISRKHGDSDSSLYYANSALALAQQMKVPDLLLRTWSELVAFYSSINRSDSTAKYQALIIQLKDSLFNVKQAHEFQNIDFDDQQRRQEIETVKKEYKDRIQKYGLLAGLVVFFIIAIILWRNNRNKQKAYALLNTQKQETDFQKLKVEQTLDELRSTQSLLIQSEKMASLGELTAGIAHEIQNPLNFVTNFSDVNNELIEELKSENQNSKSEGQTAILENIYQNNEKIKYHGKRADAIVKNMLQHSRTSSGSKEPTDINALCDEYLRLAYHGMRAKDKSFNVKIETSFDNSAEKVSVNAQEIGRVMVNLFNNAFYAVHEKRLTDNGFEPKVTVSTIKRNGALEIKVKDNGNGIPQKILDKIFQPFFTTKPAGQGTGLGLSLAYDIVKAHGGELKVETREGQGTEFSVELSTKSN